MALIGSIDSFNPKRDSWIIYQEQLEQFFNINGIKKHATVASDNQSAGELDKRVSALLSLIGSDTYKILRDLCTPDLPSTKAYEDLCNLLKTHFSPTTCIFRERIEFYNAKQEEYENVNDWYAKIHNLSTNCEFGVQLQNILKDKFVCGLKQGKIRDRLCEEKPTTTLNKLLEIAQARESSIQAESKDVHFLHKKKPVQQQKYEKAHGTARNFSNKMDRENSSRSGKWKCKCCGNFHTGKQNCKYSNYTCNKCKVIGHLSKVCNNTKSIRQNTLDVELDNDCVDINSIYITNEKPLYLNVNINNNDYKMQVDTGAGLSVISYDFYERHLSECELKHSFITLRSYSGCKIKPIGCVIVNIKFENVICKKFMFQVVRNDTPTQNLLGRDFLEKFNFKLTADVLVTTVNNREQLFNEFANIFQNKLGCYKYKQVDLQVAENTKPIYLKPRPIPIAFRSKVEQELTRLEKEGVISAIESSEWGTPIVPIIKQDGNLKICGDYRVTLNKHLLKVMYPLPTMEHIFSLLNGGESFTKIDLSNAYNQICVNEESAMKLAWSTHRGIFKLNRLPYGITPASAIFEREMEKLLQGCNGVANFLDDIIITGKTREDHEKNIREVFKRLEDAGLQLKKEKCAFFQDEVSYLGYTISKEGLKKNSDKQRAIIDAPRPENVTQVKSFIGMVTYYGKFVPKLSIIMKPIFELLKKNNKYIWTDACGKAFEEIKRIIGSDEILVHFDPKIPIILQTDACQDGIAGALLHKFPNGQLKPIAFISRTLMPAEKNYSTLDKEALAIYWSVRRFYHYLMGQEFTIQTDHKPLTSIFGENKGIPQMAATRLQRWALFLSGFAYKTEYINGKNNQVADMLSRHPIKVKYISDDYNAKSTYINLIISDKIPVNFKSIATETRKDFLLSKVVEYIMTGWPEKIEREELLPFFRRRFELYNEQGCIMWGYRVVIPRKFQDQLLEELHSSHMGVVKMKSIARSYFFWPKIDKCIEEMCNACTPCQTISNNPSKSITIPWNKPEGPWQRIHIDFLGPINKSHYLIILDAYSKYPEIFRMNNITAEETTQKLRESFARWGIPKTVISDNGPQLVSRDFNNFLLKNGIKHITSAPYHPASNGAAENAVKSFKKCLKASLLDKRNKDISPDIIVCRYLINYRNSVHCTTNETPSFMMMGRKVRTLFDLLKPHKNEKLEVKGRTQTLKEGEKVLIKDYRNKNNPIFIEGIVKEAQGTKNYICETKEGHLWRRHIDQIKKLNIQASTEKMEDKEVRRFIPKTPSITITTIPISPNPIDNTNSESIPEIANQTVIVNTSNKSNNTVTQTRSGRKVSKPVILKNYYTNI